MIELTCGSEIANTIFQKYLASKKFTTEKVIPPSYIIKKNIPTNPYTYHQLLVNMHGIYQK